MKRMTRTLAVSLLCLALAGWVSSPPAWAQSKAELSVALSSFATEVLDPALGGHLVKYYLSLQFDYLVGTTPDGLPSPNGGIATKWEHSPDYRRWTFQLLTAAILIRVIASWLGGLQYSKWLRPVYALTDWLVIPIQRRMPPFGMLDLSPLVAYLVLMVARWAIFQVLPY